MGSDRPSEQRLDWLYKLNHNHLAWNTDKIFLSRPFAAQPVSGYVVVVVVVDWFRFLSLRRSSSIGASLETEVEVEQRVVDEERETLDRERSVAGTLRLSADAADRESHSID